MICGRLGCFSFRILNRGKRQRSFNWQSIAFVMRGLWVQIPPLAFGA